MAKRSHKTRKSRINLNELVLVAFAEDSEQAKEYEALLKTNDIPALVKPQNGLQEDVIDKFAIMVPEEFLDEAHVIIESQDAYDDFYDLALEDSEADDFGEDFFDDEF